LPLLFSSVSSGFSFLTASEQFKYPGELAQVGNREVRNTIRNEIRGSHGSENWDYGLLRCDTSHWRRYWWSQFSCQYLHVQLRSSLTRKRHIQEFHGSVSIEKLLVVRLLNRDPAFCEIRSFILGFSKARHWSIFWIRCTVRSSPETIRVLKSRRIRRVCMLSRKGDIINAHRPRLNWEYNIKMDLKGWVWLGYL
jgi:hypothetical protein